MDFLTHLKTYLSEEEINKLSKALEKENEHALLLNTEKLSVEELLTIYPNLKPHPIVKNAFLYNKKENDLGKSVYHELGCFYLQEPSAMLPAYLLDPKPGELVLDLCAAPGGKSMQASLLMQNKGLIIANDIAKNRAFAINENAERMGRGNLLITCNDFSTINQYFSNYFDKIILDAPCSGSGMFRKEIKMRDDWSYQKVLKNQERQKDLIIMAYQMLKPGGKMIYSTCSFSYEEDEEVIDYLLNNSDATLENIPDNPLFYKCQMNPKGIHLLPSLFPGEGHYIALINKPGQITLKEKIEKPLNHSYLDINSPYPYFQKYGDYLYTMSQEINIKHLNIIRYGIKVGEIDKNNVRYDYHYARFIKDFPTQYALNKEQLKQYYQGETLNAPLPKGYVLLTYQGINVDIAKSDGRIIKNHLPKGLRKKIIV